MLSSRTQTGLDSKNILWASGHSVIHIQLPEHLRLSKELDESHFPVFFADLSKTGWYGFPMSKEAGIIKLGYHSPGIKVPIQQYPILSKHFPKSFLITGFQKFINENIPILKDSVIVYTRLCLYCDTFDGDFLISHVPGVDGVVIAAGGSGHAFKFAPVLGEIIVDVIEKKPNRFAPRFKWRVPQNRDSNKEYGGWSNRPGTIDEQLSKL